jgi:hypothetical protein
VSDEALLVVQRINILEATRATLLQMAVSSVISAESGKGFQKLLAEMTEV